MISQEARDLFTANVAAMTAGDAPHLAVQVLPEGVNRRKDIAYIDDGSEAHLLDVYTPADAEAGTKLPVIVDFHGGGLYYGNKENNECRDMLLAKQGFAVVNANYSLVPSVSFPAQLKDAMAVLDWIRDRGAEYGLDAERVCVTGDSAGGALALYLTAANGSPQLAGALGLKPSGVDVKALVVTSGMFRLSGGVHATALSYYMEGYLQTPADRIKITPYLDLDKLIVDGAVPPIYMITSVEDFIADNTYELARILHARHKDHAMSVWPKGTERALGHVFNIVQAGDPEAAEAHQVVRDIADYCKHYI
ncbi:alpha/beta hydrolase [Bifidobacterium callitrichidarum]|uniref:Alpha/beta hydrolase n=1 Tax=Bifidobacterium callitrichidarum TaxID=2052941 RepID=A0A2U2NBB6_9BIFI|nr:alpha/beta hydrolase [Bifidobacterium callitrichidarum]PWG66324.1 alpha/beta hydrolase [Bifidobacterium callitrichidarum]